MRERNGGGGTAEAAETAATAVTAEAAARPDRPPPKRKERERTVPSPAWYELDYSILLVDPPKSGLDEQVCDMVINGPFEHVIYVSCGRRALLRDLMRMGDEYFVVADCLLIDLFPGTDSVESLVHLRRRRKLCGDDANGGKGREGKGGKGGIAKPI